MVSVHTGPSRALKRVLNIVWQVLRGFGGYLLYVATILTIVGALAFVGSSHLGLSVFKIYGSWFLLTAAHWVGKSCGNSAMRQRVNGGDTSGAMSKLEIAWLEAKVVLAALGVAAGLGWYSAGKNGALVAAIGISLPVLIGTDSEVKRWLKGIKRLSVTKPKSIYYPELHYVEIVKELDRFPELPHTSGEY
jgi:hypothetical protein